MSGYLIYHPSRAVAKFDAAVVYHDHIGGNQDPYVWNTQFLHTYCHITQMKPSEGDINFWVSGDSFPNFSHLYCDLVFVVAEKAYWKSANTIDRDNAIVDTDEATTTTTVGRISIISNVAVDTLSKQIQSAAFSRKMLRRSCSILFPF